jgi:hypothetical protein
MRQASTRTAAARSRAGAVARGWVALVLSTIITVTATAAGTKPASAFARGCTVASLGQVCMTVQGTGLHVSWVRVSRGKSAPICNFYADVRIYMPTGPGVFAYTGAQQGGCPPPYGYQRQDFNIDGDFADQSRICGRWFEGGQQQGGGVCETIHR